MKFALLVLFLLYLVLTVSSAKKLILPGFCFQKCYFEVFIYVSQGRRAANSVLSRGRRARNCGSNLWEECVVEGCSVEEVHELLVGPQDPTLKIAIRIHEVLREERPQK